MGRERPRIHGYARMGRERPRIHGYARMGGRGKRTEGSNRGTEMVEQKTAKDYRTTHKRTQRTQSEGEWRAEGEIIWILRVGAFCCRDECIAKWHSSVWGR